jgi:hypothetical protein
VTCMRHPAARVIVATFGLAGAAARTWPVEQGRASPPPTRRAPAVPTRPAPPTNADTERAPIVVNTSVDRTAVWIGDPIVYTIEITCPPGSDILAADISRDRLKLTGLDVASAIEQRDVRADGTIVHRAQFRLVSFVTDGSRVGIEPQPVRYYVRTAGQPPETLVPADEVRLPARRIAVRSTLPEGDVEWIRDERPIATLPWFVRYLRPIGLAAVALTIVPVIIGLTLIAPRRWKPRPAGRSRRQALQLRRRAFEDIRGLDASTDTDVRRDVFARLDSLIRDQLSDLNIPAHNLTADEIELAIAERRKQPAVDDIAEILRTCERAVYGRTEEIPGPEAVSAALDATERLLTERAR